MNLPASATDFLDVFRGAFARELWSVQRLPTVHVYAFSASEDPKDDIRERVSEMLAGGKAGGCMDMELHIVRDVAPKKLMVAMLVCK
jgi:tRNA (guanine37-N1)-methyltransferase